MLFVKFLTSLEVKVVSTALLDSYPGLVFEIVDSTGIAIPHLQALRVSSDLVGFPCPGFYTFSVVFWFLDRACDLSHARFFSRACDFSTSRKIFSSLFCQFAAILRNFLSFFFPARAILIACAVFFPRLRFFDKPKKNFIFFIINLF